MNENGTLAWHFLRGSRQLRNQYTGCVEAGKTYAADGPLVICKNGMHGSIRALDALTYAPGPCVCRVLMHGETIDGGDKLCSRYRTVIWMADGRRMLHEFALRCAEQALQTLRDQGRELPAELWRGIETSRAWLQSEATDEDLCTAIMAVWLITLTDRSVKDCSWHVIWNAVANNSWVAARDAAKFGSYIVADAAYCIGRATPESPPTTPEAVWDTIRAAQNAELEAMLLKLAPSEQNSSQEAT